PVVFWEERRSRERSLLENRLSPPRFSASFEPRMADRKTGCLTLFLFVALCPSLFLNFILTVALFRRGVAAMADQEPLARFREITVERGRGLDKVVLTTMRGVISSSVPGSVGDSMVDDFRAALRQAGDDVRVKAIVLEI